jgi:hypothetical protein
MFEIFYISILFFYYLFNYYWFLKSFYEIGSELNTLSLSYIGDIALFYLLDLSPYFRIFYCLN